ncbi:MAG: type II toxin-antitoxin system RelE/ParE family toxin [Thiohalomonadales bacterium]
MRVEWTEPALDDMVAIRDYIAEDSPENAYRFIERLFDAAEPLVEQPKMGRQVPEAERQDVRELLYKDYRIIYLVKTEQVDILTVVHGSRNLNLLKTMPWDTK